MSRTVRCSSTLLLLALAACLPADENAESLDVHTQPEFSTESPFRASYPSVHLRGTMNGWAATPMKRVSDHNWSGEVTFGTDAGQRFKFDIHGDWSLNFGDNDGDRIADQDGRDIEARSGVTYIIHFNDVDRTYGLEEKTWSATVSFELPRGANREAFAGAYAKLLRDEQLWGWSYIHVDGEHPRPYSPVCCLTKGSTYALKLELTLEGKRFVGETAWRVDGTIDPIELVMVVTEASNENHGTVEVSVFADRWENDRLVSAPYRGVGVYRGDWHAGEVLGHTGDDGRVSTLLPAGAHALSAMVMTSSHSIASGSSTVTVRAGETHAAEIHIAPTTVVIRASHDAGVGNALYVTGAGSYLGDWDTAVKMTWDPSYGQWVLRRNLPLGLPFKIVKGPWMEGETIQTSDVQWERGENRVVTPPYGYYESHLQVEPTF